MGLCPDARPRRAQGLYNTVVGQTQDLSKEGVLDAVASDFEATFCSAAVYTPASKNPASLTGAPPAARGDPLAPRLPPG